MNNKREHKKRSVNLIFMIIGAALIIGGIIAVAISQDFKKTAVATDATIKEIIITTDSDDENHYSIRVVFFADGVEYEGVLGYHNAWMKEGKTLKIYYDPEDPQDFRAVESDIVVSIVLFILGAACLFVGVFPAITAVKNKGRDLEPKEE